MGDPILGDQQFVPNRLVLSDRSRFYRDPESGILSIQISKDAGSSWKNILVEPPSYASDGWTPTLNSSGGVEWRPPKALSTSTSSSSALNSLWVDFQFPGALQADKTFGFFSAPSGSTLKCFGAQVSAFSPPTSGAVSIVLLRKLPDQVESFEPIGPSIVLPAGALVAEATFSPVIEIPPRSSLKMRVIAVGQEDPGEFLSCRLMLSS